MNEKTFNKIYKYLNIFGYVLATFFLVGTITSFIIYPSFWGLLLGLSITGLMTFLYFFFLNKFKK